MARSLYNSGPGREVNGVAMCGPCVDGHHRDCQVLFKVINGTQVCECLCRQAIAVEHKKKPAGKDTAQASLDQVRHD